MSKSSWMSEWLRANEWVLLRPLWQTKNSLGCFFFVPKWPSIWSSCRETPRSLKSRHSWWWMMPEPVRRLKKCNIKLRLIQHSVAVIGSSEMSTQKNLTQTGNIYKNEPGLLCYLCMLSCNLGEASWWDSWPRKRLAVHNHSPHSHWRSVRKKR